VIDPSELLRPEPSFAKKPVAQFRDYTIDENDPIKERVRRTYKEMHTHQTVQFVQGILTSAMLLKLRHFEIKRRHFTSFYVRIDRNKLGPNRYRNGKKKQSVSQSISQSMIVISRYKYLVPFNDLNNFCSVGNTFTILC
jgi:hypothetical protein